MGSANPLMDAVLGTLGYVSHWPAETRAARAKTGKICIFYGFGEKKPARGLFSSLYREYHFFSRLQNTADKVVLYISTGAGGKLQPSAAIRVRNRVRRKPHSADDVWGRASVGEFRARNKAWCTGVTIFGGPTIFFFLFFHPRISSPPRRHSPCE